MKCISSRFYKDGGVAQMVERSLSMREVPGSIPGASKSVFFCITLYILGSVETTKNNRTTVQSCPDTASSEKNCRSPADRTGEKSQAKGLSCHFNGQKKKKRFFGMTTTGC